MGCGGNNFGFMNYYEMFREENKGIMDGLK